MKELHFLHIDLVDFTVCNDQKILQHTTHAQKVKKYCDTQYKYVIVKVLIPKNTHKVLKNVSNEINYYN